LGWWLALYRTAGSYSRQMEVVVVLMATWRWPGATLLVFGRQWWQKRLFRCYLHSSCDRILSSAEIQLGFVGYRWSRDHTRTKRRTPRRVSVDFVWFKHSQRYLAGKGAIGASPCAVGAIMPVPVVQSYLRRFGEQCSWSSAVFEKFYVFSCSWPGPR
jgi:hypothetical protein